MKLNTSRENQRLLSVRRSSLKNRPTVAESYVMSLLDEAGERYCFQKGFYTNIRHFIVDFYLPKRGKLCLEVDGEYHRTCEQIAYDAVRDKFLTEVRGFRVIRISNETAMGLNVDSLLKLIR